jgi:glutaredoxin-like YruB-family protein
MTLKKIESYNELRNEISDKQRSFLLLYKEGSEQSECSIKNLKAIDKSVKDISLYSADVTSVRDIHEKYSISSVPVIIEFAKGEMVNVLKGCHNPEFYKSFLENAIFSVKSSNNQTQNKRVTIYTTPSCSWCTTLKTYLKKNGINFREIDVSRDQKSAEEMQRRSGQMGVPQTDINGEIIVGFDKNKLNKLLGIQTV